MADDPACLVARSLTCRGNHRSAHLGGVDCFLLFPRYSCFGCNGSLLSGGLSDGSNVESHPKLDSQEEVLAQLAWVRSLSRSLLADEHLAEDLSQETLRVALERKPDGDGGLKGWLAKVARDLRSNLYRGEARRVRREKIAAQEETVPSSADMVEWAEWMREVIDAVNRLAEPYRTTILLRYFKELPPHQIAKRLGIPGGTVRSRLKRGIEKLRIELKSRNGEECYASRLAFLLPQVAGAGSLTSTGSLTHWMTAVFTMTKKTKLAVAAVGLLLAVFLVWKGNPLDQGPPVQIAATGAHPGLDSQEQRPISIAAVGEVGHRRIDVGPAQDGPRGAFTIRIVDTSGNAIPGARVQAGNVSKNHLISGFTAKSWDVWRHEANFDTEARTDELGHARLDGVRTDMPIVVYATADGFALTGGMWASENGAEEQELGDLVVSAGAGIELSVLDQDRLPVEDAKVLLQADPVMPVGTLYLQTDQSDPDGKVVFPHLVNRPHRIEIQAAGFLAYTAAELRPGPQGRVRLEAILDRGLSIAGTVLQADGAVAQGVPIHVLAEGAPGFDDPTRRIRPPKTVLATTGPQGGFVATGLVQNTLYRVLARRGPTLWAVSEPVPAGSNVTLALPRSHRVRGRLLLADGQPAANGQIGFINTELPFRETKLFSYVGENGRFDIELAEATYGVLGNHPGGNGLFDPVSVQGTTELGGLVLPTGAPLKVTVLSSWDQSPVPYPWISPSLNPSSLYEYAVVNKDTWRSRIRQEARNGLRMITWVAENEVHLRYLQPGHHQLRATATWFVPKSFDVELKGTEPQELTIFMDPAARVHLNLMNPDGSPAGVREFMLRSVHENGRLQLKGPSENAITAQDGVAVFQQISPGRYRLTTQDQWARGLGHVEVGPGENHLDFVLPHRPNVTVVVHEEVGPSAGVEVALAQLNQDWEPIPERLVTNQDGVARFESIWPGEYQVRVGRAGSPGLQREVAFQSAEEQIEFRFEGTSVVGLVLATSAVEPAGGRVSLWGYPLDPTQGEEVSWESLHDESRMATTSTWMNCDDDGNFKFRDVLPGLYRIRATAPGFLNSESTELRVGNDPVTGLRFSLEPECRLMIRVNGAKEYSAQHSVDFFYARLFDQSDRRVGLKGFTEDGELTVDKLRPGTYKLRMIGSRITGDGMKDFLLEELAVEIEMAGTTKSLDWVVGKTR